MFGFTRGLYISKLHNVITEWNNAIKLGTTEIKAKENMTLIIISVRGKETAEVR